MTQFNSRPIESQELGMPANLILPNPAINLIGIMGKAGSGKDTLAHGLANTYAYTYTDAFANPLKEACATLFGISLFNFNERNLKEAIDKFWNISPRQITQFVGTEVVRESFKDLLDYEVLAENFWIHRMLLKFQEEVDNQDEPYYEPGDTVIISDVRFQNEYNWIIQNNGIMIHLTRDGADGTVGIPSHKSENGITFISEERHYEISNNSSKENLLQIAKLILGAAKLQVPLCIADESFI